MIHIAWLDRHPPIGRSFHCSGPWLLDSLREHAEKRTKEAADRQAEKWDGDVGVRNHSEYPPADSETRFVAG